jgi:hypothetical protein
MKKKHEDENDVPEEEPTEQELARAITEALEFARRDKWEDLTLEVEEELPDEAKT